MKERLLKFLAHLGVGQHKFEKSAGLSIGYINKLKGDMKLDTINKIISTYPELNKEWLMYGDGEMLNSEKEEQSGPQFYYPENLLTGKRLIPLYDDVATIGGKPRSGYSAKLDPDSSLSEWIDPGDWFKSATHAIRHYEDSMIEYPPGCIIAMKEVYDRRLIIPGKDYVIETSEYRVTKRVRLGNTPDYIFAHSTNEEKYDNGELVHQPFPVQWELVLRIFEVLGYVVKKGSGTIVNTDQNKKI